MTWQRITLTEEDPLDPDQMVQVTYTNQPPAVLRDLVSGVQHLLAAMEHLDQWVADGGHMGGRPDSGDLDQVLRYYWERMGALQITANKDPSAYTANFWEWLGDGAKWEDLYWEAPSHTPQIGPKEEAIRNAIRRLEERMSQATSLSTIWKELDAERQILITMAEQASLGGE